jgi:hypothetical protein
MSQASFMIIDQFRAVHGGFHPEGYLPNNGNGIMSMLMIKAIAAVAASGEARFQKAEQAWVDHFITATDKFVPLYG